MAQWSVADAEQSSVFTDLVFFSEQLISTGEATLSAPSTIIVFGVEFTLYQSVLTGEMIYLGFSIPTIQTFESSAGSEFIVTWRSSPAWSTTIVSKYWKERGKRGLVTLEKRTEIVKLDDDSEGAHSSVLA